ncbi:MAG: MFS transporter [Acidimicrobiia bacterium]|nr:MFS transporter [Acidimicrobiia bacterium]
MGETGVGAPTPMANPTFRRLVAAWSVGNLADSALFLTLAVWMKDLTGSSSAAGLVFLALGAPVILAPPIGLLADRVRRRPLLIAANLTGAAVAATLLGVGSSSDLWVIYGVAFAYGSLGILNNAAQSGLLRDILPDEQLDAANGILTTIDQGLRIATPAGGVAVYAVLGAHALALVVGGLLMLTAILLTATRVVESAPDRRAEGSTFWSENLAGLRHLRSVPVLWRMIAVGAIAFGVIGSFDTLIFEIVEHGLDRSPSFVAILLSLQGAGSILGGLSAARVLRRRGALGTVGLALAVMGTAVMVMAVAVLTVPLLPVVAGAMFGAGVSVPWMIVAMTSTRVRLTPPQLQGRAAAAMNMGLTVPQLASSAAGAAIVTIVDYRWLAGAAAVVLLACAARLVLDRVEIAGSGAQEPYGQGTLVP